MRKAALLAVAVLLAWSLVDLAARLATTPLAIVAGAAGPALFFAVAIVCVDRERAPSALLAAAFALGASVAPYSSEALNDALRFRLGAALGAARAGILAPGVVGPVVEEAAKAAALAVLLLVRRGALRGAADGLVYGAMIGVGFTMAENLSYLTLAAVQGGQAGLERAVYTRGVLGGLNHAVFAATTGAALGAALRARRRAARWLLAAGGFAAAVAQHAIWNLTASRAITTLLCDPELPGGPCRASPSAWRLYVDIPLVSLACLGPGIALLGIVWWATRRRMP